MIFQHAIVQGHAVDAAYNRHEANLLWGHGEVVTTSNPSGRPHQTRAAKRQENFGDEGAGNVLALGNLARAGELTEGLHGKVGERPDGMGRRPREQ
jgi:hypothetical protein